MPLKKVIIKVDILFSSVLIVVLILLSKLNHEFYFASKSIKMYLKLSNLFIHLLFISASLMYLIQIKYIYDDNGILLRLCDLF